MRIAVCPGSFDPFTVGHLDVIERADKLFDKVIVLVMLNPDKKPSFTGAERVGMIKAAVSQLENTEVDLYDGLVTDYAKAKGACAIVKGLRTSTDFEYEFQMAAFNKKLYPEAETLFLMADVSHMTLSSSAVKQLAKFGGDISPYVPAVLHDAIRQRLTMGRECRI